MADKKYNNIEDLVRDYVMFHGESSGWNSCYCEFCGDGKRVKGPRGGWLFQDGMAFYNCFNAGCEGSYDPDRQYPMSRDMGGILEAFGVPMRAYKMLQLHHKKASGHADKKPEVKQNPLIELSKPSHWYLLSDADADDLIAIKANKFLKGRRIDPASYPFYLSTGKPDKSGDVREQAITKGMRNRIIIPAYRGEKLIYWQGRDLDGTAKNKYMSPDTPRSNVLYNYDRLYENIKSPLFITEGFWDAHQLSGVSTMENKFSSQQQEILKRSPRKKVVVPDRRGDSNRLAEQAVALGWGVSIPIWGSDVKDVTDAVLKYGRLYVAQSIMDNIRFGATAAMSIKMRL